MKFLPKHGLLAVLVGAPVLYISSCTWIKHSRTFSFESVNIGESLTETISKMGTPSHIDSGSEYFARYIDWPCKGPKCKRLWYENRLFLDIEAWAIQTDSAGHVIAKDHIVSP